MPLSLYIHYPFCRRRCPYCDFFKAVPKTGDSERFIRALLQEIELAASAYQWTKSPLSTVYFGGGTPSLLSPADILSILDRVREFWAIKTDAEITIEANPGGLTEPDLRQWVDAGINRLSIGGQSFSGRMLGLLYRDHAVADIQRAADVARKSGFVNISCDLIFGLPDETLEEWRADLEAVLALDVAHISLYNLEIHEDTPFHRWRESGRLPVVNADLEAEMYLLAAERLTAAGYEHYEISNFARPGFRSRHNCAYWNRTPYLGLGPSAHSFDGVRTRTHNVANLPQFFAVLDNGRLPIAEVQETGERERAEEWIALRLRLREGFTKQEATATLGFESTGQLWQRAKLLPDGQVKLTAERLAMTPRGWFAENSVLAFLLEGLD